VCGSEGGPSSVTFPHLRMTSVSRLLLSQEVCDSHGSGLRQGPARDSCTKSLGSKAANERARGRYIERKSTAKERARGSYIERKSTAKERGGGLLVRSNVPHR